MNYAKSVVLIFLMIASPMLIEAKVLLSDSLGLEKHGEQLFIIHKVEAKETLFALSRRYKVGVEDIQKHNPELSEGLKIGQMLKIPYAGQAPGKQAEKSHIVQPGETLFSISRQYGVQVDDIKKWNGLGNNEIFIGQELMFYKQGSGAAYAGAITEKAKEAIPQATQFDEKKGELTHKVSPGETLFSISRKYEVSVEDIKKWNKLTSNDLSIDQVLVVGSPGEQQKYTPQMPQEDVTAKQDNVLASEPPVEEKIEESIATVKSDNSKNEPAKPGQTLDTKVAEEKPLKPITEPLDENMNSRKIVELGLAEVIDGVADNKKYLALHRTAPIGTIMQVRNEMNNTSVFVRVVGKLPDTGENNKVLIKLSRTAYEKLGAVNARFPVEISYFPKGL